MKHTRLIQILSTVGMILCLVGAGLLNPPILQQRQTLQLSRQLSEQADIGPTIQLAQALLGSFRGILVDFLWYRAENMKQNGQHREALQLAQIICTLQPNFDRVWSINAWNMAYNISVTTHTQEERWSWVNKGIRLLRDKGIKINPRSVRLKKELGWIFFHKIGAMSDDAHWYYRRKLAHEWQEVLGSPEAMSYTQILQRIKDIVDAPTSLAELEKDDKAKVALDYFRSLEYQPDENLLRAVGKVIMFRFSGDRQFFDVNQLQQQGQLPDRRIYQALIGNPQLAQKLSPGMPKLMAYLRKKVLVQTYNMDPAYMLKLMSPIEEDLEQMKKAGKPVPEGLEAGYGFGPLDWRHPCAHSAYWAAQGIEQAKKARLKKDIDQLNTDRLVIHSMQTLMRFGKISYDPVTRFFDMSPDPRFIESYRRAMGYATERIQTGEYSASVESNFDSGYENFLSQAIQFCYLYGQQGNAVKYHSLWRKQFSQMDRNQSRRFLSLDEFVLAELEDNLGGMLSNKRQFIDAMIHSAFVKGLAAQNSNAFYRFITVAKQAHTKHNQSKGHQGLSDRQRMGMAPFMQLVEQSYARLMVDPRYNLLMRARIWQRTPGASPDAVYLQRATYDQIRLAIEQQANQAGLDPKRVLPQPPGMDEFRKRRDQRRQAAQEDDSYATERK